MGEHVQINFIGDPETKAALEDLCAQTGMSQSALLRNLILLAQARAFSMEELQAEGA